MTDLFMVGTVVAYFALLAMAVHYSRQNGGGR